MGIELDIPVPPLPVRMLETSRAAVLRIQQLLGNPSIE
jgi:hypothetical protein